MTVSRRTLLKGIAGTVGATTATVILPIPVESNLIEAVKPSSAILPAANLGEPLGFFMTDGAMYAVDGDGQWFRCVMEKTGEVTEYKWEKFQICEGWTA